jgi:hypothetical protein
MAISFEDATAEKSASALSQDPTNRARTSALKMQPYQTIQRCICAAGRTRRGSFFWVLSRRYVVYRDNNGRCCRVDTGRTHYVGPNTRVLPIQPHPGGWQLTDCELLLDTALFILKG